MPAAWAAAAAAVIGAASSADSSRKSSNTQADAASHAVNSQMQMFNTINDQNKPWLQQGTTAINQLGAMTAPGGQFTHQFNASDLNANLAPNYQFQLDQGLGATKNAANLQTGLVSGNALKGINDYAQNFAGNAYQNAFNNYNTGQTNIFNRLASIAGTGQTASNLVGNAGMGSVGAANAYLTGGAAAQAAGQVGQSNAISKGFGDVGNYSLLNSIMNSGGGNNSSSTQTSSSSSGGGGLMGMLGGLFGGGSGGGGAGGGGGGFDASGFTSGGFSGGAF